MNEKQQKELIEAFIAIKFKSSSQTNEGLNYSNAVKMTQNHLCSLGIWEESKDIFKKYLNNLNLHLFVNLI
jgi:hypothetical protein